MLRNKTAFRQIVRLVHNFSAEDETRHFNKLAKTWWDTDGPQRILHKMNLVRMDFIQATIRNGIPLVDKTQSPENQVYVPGYNIQLFPEFVQSQIVADQEHKRDLVYDTLKLNVLDIGCGGGLLSESMARLPIVDSVKGIDLAEEVVEVAKQHRDQDPVIKDKIKYELMNIEKLPQEEQFDVITMFEILEHVDDPKKFLSVAIDHLKKDGYLFLSTINKDFISWFTTIFMGEYVMKIVPVGTHHLEKYVNHEFLQEVVRNDLNVKGKKFQLLKSKGTSYLPFYGWYLHEYPNTGNYFMAIKRVE